MKRGDVWDSNARKQAAEVAADRINGLGEVRLGEGTVFLIKYNSCAVKDIVTVANLSRISSLWVLVNFTL